MVVAPYTYTDPAGWDVVVLADAHDVANRGAFGKVDRLLNAPLRVYALVPPGGCRGPLARMAVLHAAGPVVRRLGPEPAAVKVTVCRPATLPAARDLAGLAYKRAAYWHNDRRNAAVADVAVAWAAGDVAGLWGHGLLDEPRDLPRWFGGRPRVVVLAEGVEQGMAIVGRLPGWVLRAERQGSGAGRPGASFSAGGAGEVVTVTYAARRGVGDADVLVRADGGGGPPAAKDFPPEGAGGTERRVFLVDFDDDFDAPARHDTRRRLAGYAARGWDVPASQRLDGSLRHDERPDDMRRPRRGRGSSSAGRPAGNPPGERHSDGPVRTSARPTLITAKATKAPHPPRAAGNGNAPGRHPNTPTSGVPAETRVTNPKLGKCGPDGSPERTPVGTPQKRPPDTARVPGPPSHSPSTRTDKKEPTH